MMTARLVLVASLSALGLSACGSNTHQTPPFKSSSNCAISVTNVDYAGCDLDNRDFEGLDVSSDNFRRSNLTDANMDGANLQGVDLQGAKTKGVQTNSSTVCENATFGPCTKSGLRGS